MSRKKEKGITVILGIVAAVIIIGGVFIFNSTKTSDDVIAQLEGLWIFDSVTSYEFDLENNGILHVSEREFSFTYKVTGTELHIDFADEKVQDCVYAISIEGEMLYMEGKDGTSGGKYELMKKNI